jgi:hypothetical protein
LFLFPDAEQSQLRFFESILSCERRGTGRADPIETISKGLRREALRGESPNRVQDTTAIPIGDLGFWTRLANAVNGSQQEVVSGGRTGAGYGPE